VTEQFVVELAHSEVDGLDILNSLFSAWVESVYHRRVHSETGEAPIERFMADGPPELPSDAQLHEAFLWSERRQVTKTADVSLFGNHYEVDALLVGQSIELVFDPFDLTDIEVRFGGRPMGKAVPRRIGRHVHPKARPEPPEVAPRATGIDYLRLVEQRRAAELDRRIDYRQIEKTNDNDNDNEEHS